MDENKVLINFYFESMIDRQHKKVEKPLKKVSLSPFNKQLQLHALTPLCTDSSSKSSCKSAKGIQSN